MKITDMATAMMKIALQAHFAATLLLLAACGGGGGSGGGTGTGGTGAAASLATGGGNPTTPTAVVDDTDRDGVRDSLDAYPRDPTRSSSVIAVGDASVSTCNIMVPGSGTPTGNDCFSQEGTMKIKDVDVSSKQYLNFLMTGGDGTADVGIRLLVAGTANEVASYKSDSCGDKYIDEAVHWRHFDVSSLTHGGSAVNAVDIEIYDNATTGPCGFVAFDHIYLGDMEQGTMAQ